MRNFLISLLIFLLPLTQILPAPVVRALDLDVREARAATAHAAVKEPSAENEVKTVYDLVAIVVDRNLYSNGKNFEGLRGAFPGSLLSENEFEGRITRYAQDIVASNELTDTKLLFYDREEDSVRSIRQALENLYINGDGTERNRLAGVVLVGDVPLPVVDKNGNRFVSMFPYTDFDDPAYLYDEEAGAFVPNTAVSFPKPEIWHGVIRAPEDGDSGLQKLATFFDKNHLYYAGVPEYANFQKKLFFGDLYHEQENVNEDSFKDYLRYLEGLEDMAYQRFNKYWADEVLAESSASLSSSFENGGLTEEGAEFLESSGSLGEGSDDIPDIFTKNIIEQNLPPYFRVFSKFISEINDWADYTGRYSALEVDHVPGLISIKDEFTKAYLRGVNDAIEEAVNEIAGTIQEPLPILEMTRLSGQTAGGEKFKVKVGENDLGGIVIPEYVNTIALRYPYRNEVSGKLYLNGVDLEVLESPKQCSVFLGSTRDEYFDAGLSFDPKRIEGGEYSVLTRSIRSDNPVTAAPTHTIGVNVRMLSPAEASERTGGRASSGAVIESNPAYGIAAFEPNHLSRAAGDYANPLDGPLQEGDVITKVNGKDLNYEYTLDQAVEEAYKAVEKILNRRDNSSAGIAERGTLTFEFYRGSAKRNHSATFTILKRKNQDFTVATNTALDKAEYESDGVIFTMYLAVGLDSDAKFEGDDGFGYADQGFDNSAGCNYAMTYTDSDRCFYQVASVPLLDPAGSTSLQNVDGNLRFVDRIEGREVGEYNDIFQYPAGYDLDQIDEVYLNSCYAGMSSVAASDSELANDSNQYQFPLDKTTKTDRTESSIAADVYGRFLNFVGNFVYPGGYKSQKKPSEHELWFDVDNLKASGVVLNDSPRITLEDLAIAQGATGMSLNELARKFLSRKATYSLDGKGVLNVDPVVYKEISSVILHNEPTAHTITEQLNSFGTKNLPIDNPRYVAFQNVTGGVSKIYYPNLFETPNFAQVEADLNALANKLAVVPGSYRVMGPRVNAGDYSLLQIRNEILKKFLDPVVNSTLDDPISGYDLTAANTKKVNDALEWLSLSIDDKHEYVLEHYLNSKKDAYVADSPLGYEAAYLLLDSGDGENIRSAFNKDKPEEKDPYFDKSTEEYRERLRVESGLGDDDDDDSGGAGGGDGEEGGVSLFNWLDQELLPFIDSFSNIGQVEECCNYAANVEEGGDGFGGGGGGVNDGSGDGNSSGRLNSLTITSNKTVFSSKDGDKVILKVEAVDSGGKKVNSAEIVTLNLTQRSTDPLFKTGATKAPLLNGEATFTLIPTGAAGNAIAAVSSDSGISSNSVNLSATQKNIEVVSEVYFAPENEVAGEVIEPEIEVQEPVLEESGGQKPEEENGFGESESENLPGESDQPAARGGVEGEVYGGSGVVSDGTGRSESGASEPQQNSGDEGGGENAEDATGDASDGVIQNQEDENTQSESGGRMIKVDDNGAQQNQNEDNEDLEEVRSESSEGSTVQWQNYYIFTKYYQKFLELEWEDFYIDTDYFRKFLDEEDGEDIESGEVVGKTEHRTLLASLIGFVPENRNPFVDAEENTESKYVLQQTDQLSADGKSLMQIKAQIFDAEGNLETDRSHRVRFEVDSDISQAVTFENGDTVTSENGVARVLLKAGTKSGAVVIKGTVIDENGQRESGYPQFQKEIFLLAGAPYSVSIEADSTVLVANGQSGTEARFILKDKFGNIANNSFSTISIFADKDFVTFDESSDLNAEMPGVQIGTFEGVGSLNIFAKKKIGRFDLIAVLTDFELEEQFLELGDNWKRIDFTNEIGNSKQINVVDKVSLNLKLDKNEISADGKSIAKLRSELLYDDKVLSQYNGPINIAVVNEETAAIVDTVPQKMTSGFLHEANTRIQSTEKTGEAEILVDVPGFASDSIKLKTLPGEAVKMELSSDEEVLFTGAENKVILKAKLFDKNDNLVVTDNKTVVSFEVTAATRDLVEFGGANAARTLSGVAGATLKANDRSGFVNITARAQGLPDAYLTLEIKKKIDKNSLSGFSPRALYMSLLGSSFGDPSQNNNPAEVLLFAGESQAVSTVTATADQKKRLAMINGEGEIKYLDESLNLKVVPALKSFGFQKISFSDPREGENIADLWLVPDAKSELQMTSEEEFLELEKDSKTIALRDLSDGALIFEKEDDEAFIKRNQEVLVRIDQFGRIFPSNDKISLDLPNEEDGVSTRGLTILILESGRKIAALSFVQGFSNDLTILPYGRTQTSYKPGVYLQSNSQNEKYIFESALTGNSSEEIRGVYILDSENEIEGAQRPGFGYQSLDSALDSAGVGFEGSNKNMLFFSAGSSVGEANLPYASEVGIIYGDPLVRVSEKEKDASELSGFDQSIGKPLFTGEEPIKDLVKSDYNSDGREDILLLYESGLIRLMENTISNNNFEDRGYIANVYGGILSASKIDWNADGYDDLLIGTKESCRENEVCLTLLTNNGGHFKRETLNLEIKGKISEVKTRDLNLDGCEDVVLTDTSGTLRIFYNENNGNSCRGIENKDSYHNGFGFAIDDKTELIQNVFVSYPGMESVSADYSNYDKFIRFTLESNDKPTDDYKIQYVNAGENLQELANTKDVFASREIPAQTYNKEYDFVNATQTARFINSSKKAIDVNGASLEPGDKINYVISLENSGAALSNVLISDAVPTSMEVVKESLECLDGCGDNLRWLETGVKGRSDVIAGVTVPRNGTRVIKYTVIAGGVPDVDFEIGKDFTDYPSGDGDSYPDILVRPKINPTGELTHIYSNGLDTDGKVRYADFVAEAGGGRDDILKDEYKQAGLPGILGMLEKVGELEKLLESKGASFEDYEPGDEPVLSESELKDFELTDEEREMVSDSYTSQHTDSNYNSCPDSWEGNGFAYSAEVAPGLNNFAQNIADAMQNTMNLLRCSGAGCLPIPYNRAFLVPYGPTPGTALFASGTPGIPGFEFFYSSYRPSSFRFYVSPTATMGMGFAVCTGANPGHQSPCYPFALPMQSTGICDAFLGPINDAVAQASEFVQSEVDDMGGLVSDGSQSNGTSEGVETAISFFDNESPLQAQANINIKIPGFPGFITDWLDKQTDEIYNKLLDLPDIYLIYPELGTAIDQTSDALSNFGQNSPDYDSGGFGSDVLGGIQSIEDFLQQVNTIPFIQIETEDVTIRVPAISADEIAKYKVQAQAWIIYEKQQIQKVREFWSCDESSRNETICDKVLVDMSELISSVEKFMDDLDNIQKLPRQILTWRNLEQKYALQIICYLDAISKFFGGYIKKQQRIVNQWYKAIEQVLNILETWQILLDIIIEYQATCDQCKNDRFSQLGILLQFFAVIPEPPVFPLPKWPDVVFDFSKVHTGAKIVWPHVEFKPEPIFLPDLPVVTLPDVIPDIELEIPGFIVDFPTFQLPELPDLPPLPFPQLPDLPQPPEIPELPDFIFELAVNLQQIFRILCLIKQAKIAVPEWGLGTTIETMTQPHVHVVLSIIAQLGIKLPPIEYDYLREIRATAETSFALDTGFVYGVVRSGADIWNGRIEELVKNINNYSQFDLQRVVDAFVNTLFSRMLGAFNDAFAVCIQEGVNDEETIRRCAIEAKESCIESAGQDGEAVRNRCENAEKSALVENGVVPEGESGGVDSGTGGGAGVTPRDGESESGGESREVDYSEYYGEGETEKEEGETLTEDEEKELEEVSQLLKYMEDYGPFAELRQEYANFNQKVADYAAQLELQDLPDQYYLVADSVDLDQNHPILNRSLEEVEAGISEAKRLGLNIPENKAIDDLRDSLIAYVKESDKNNAVLEKIEDLDQLGKYLAGETVRSRKVASLTQSDIGSNQSTDQSAFFSKDLAENLDTRRIAAIDQQQALQNFVSDESGGAPLAAPRGIFVTVGDKNENVLNYDLEIEQGVKLIFDDVDKDSDTDLVYSMGGNLYLKENYKKNKSNKRGKMLSVTRENKISDFVIEEIERPTNIQSEYESVGQADVSWATVDDAASYEVYVRESLEDSFEDAVFFAEIEAAEFSGERPNLTIVIEDGNYYVNVVALDEFGRSSVVSETQVISPQVCADDDDPLPVVNSDAESEGGNFVVTIFDEVVIDASGSFDTSGKIQSYYLRDVGARKDLWSDLDLKNDSNKDGSPTNDRDNPVFRLGPFDDEGDVGDHQYLLHVIDEAGNESTQEITVKVVVPEIYLDGSLARTKVAGGGTNPEAADLPLKLMRQRYIYRVSDGELKLAPQTEKVAETVTNAEGLYEISDLTISNMLLVQNAEGATVAEINQETGNIAILLDGYETRIIQANPPEISSHVDIAEIGGRILASVYPISDPNNDVKFYKNRFSLWVDDVEGDPFTVNKIPATNERYPGGIALSDSRGDEILVLDSAGNIISVRDSFELAQKKNNHEIDPLVVVVSVGGDKVMEIGYPEIYLKNEGLILAKEDVPAATPLSPTAGSLVGIGKNSFSDASEELRPILAELTRLGVIEEDEEFNEDELLTRAEFVKILLAMLCIIPREPEAYRAYDSDEAGGGFYDIDYNNGNFEWYYPYVKEAALLGLVQGYRGETDANGLHPFKPEANISTAEAAKIILEALELKNIIDISEVEVGEPWYLPFVEAANDITPFVVGDEILKGDFIVTDEEALTPNDQVTRGEMAVMVTRVLDIYNCFEIDADNDGMSDHCEARYGIDDPDEDFDGDGISNADECFYGSDPTESDGVSGEGEIPENTRKANSGVYISPAECNTCPCSVTLIPKGDINLNDTFFTIITNPAEDFVFAKSNEVKINTE